MTQNESYTATTTLRRIGAANPCESRWGRLLGNVGNKHSKDELLDLRIILDSNGLEDTLWVVDHATSADLLARHFQAWCAEQVLHLLEERSVYRIVRDQIDTLWSDEATYVERNATRAKVYDIINCGHLEYIPWQVAQSSVVIDILGASKSAASAVEMVAWNQAYQEASSLKLSKLEAINVAVNASKQARQNTFQSQEAQLRKMIE